MKCDEGCAHAINRRCYHRDTKKLAPYVGDINKRTPKWCPLSKRVIRFKEIVRRFEETGIPPA